MTEPTTEAGRRLLATGAVPDEDADLILAIEQEARAAEHDRLSRVAWAQPVISAEQAHADLAARIDPAKWAHSFALKFGLRYLTYDAAMNLETDLTEFLTAANDAAIREASDDRRALRAADIPSGESQYP